MKSSALNWWARTKAWLQKGPVRPVPEWKASAPTRSGGDTLLARFQTSGRWDTNDGTWRLDKFFNELSPDDIQRLAFQHTRDGHNLGTLATDRAGHGWAQSYGVIPGVKARFNHLCFLVQQGLDPNTPDAQGRVATVGAFANDTRHLTVDDLDWALTRGADFLAVETPLNAPARSVLSMDLSASPVAAQLIVELQAHIVTTLEALEPADRTQALTALQGAPVDAAHALFWRELTHAHLDQALMQASTPAPRPRF